MVQQIIVLDHTIIFLTHLQILVSALYSSALLIYDPCCTLGNQTLLVAYNDGSQNPECPSGNVGSIITLKCAKEAKWRESGGKGDASDYLIGLLQNPEDACLVCQFISMWLYCSQDVYTIPTCNIISTQNVRQFHCIYDTSYQWHIYLWIWSTSLTRGISMQHFNRTVK